jgi:GNAT superfamily N-acetyltransferase/ribosomal protein S18 acetylase RimI-like enzyme
VTTKLRSLSEAEDPVSREQFLERFNASASSLRESAYAPFAPKQTYSALLLNLARERPFDAFLAEAEGRVAGRAAVWSLTAKPGAAGIGLFESAPGAERDDASAMLIDAASSWATDRGYTEIFAPIDLNTWFSHRFLLPPPDGRTHKILYSWEPVQPPEYVDAFTRRGFRNAERYHTEIMRFDHGSERSLGKVAELTSDAVTHATKAGFTFERLADPARLPALLDEAYGLCSEAFAENFLFEPIGPELFRTILLSGAAVRDSTLSHWVRDAAGQMQGFILAFADGDAVVVKTVAISPSARGNRLAVALTHLAVKEGTRRGLNSLASALVHGGNVSEILSGPFARACAECLTHEYVLLRKAGVIAPAGTLPGNPSNTGNP